MYTILEIPLRDATPSGLQDLQSKYPGAILRIEADNSLHSGGMDEEQFWAIIDLLDWRTRDSQAILSPAADALSRFSAEDIHAFHDILNQKLYALDGLRFAKQLGSNRYEPSENKHFSVDGFLYSRCCVVANGKAFFDAVMSDPAKMPREFTFESLLSLPAMAWKLKTNRDDYDYYPEVWSETFSNPEGWPGITTLKDRILNLK
jgi:hypothetical protein